MTPRMYGMLVASLSVVALLLAANETFARSGPAAHGGLTSTHRNFRPTVAHALRHHRRNNAGVFLPGFIEPPYGEPAADLTQPVAGDIHIHYTCTYDIPWDWAHRCPPAVQPSERPYAPSCPTETVTVPGHDGNGQTVNVTRCY